VPAWGPTKTKKRRTVTLGAETITQFRAHKRAQSALKMKNRTTYKNVDLMFAKKHVDLQTSKAMLGQPLTTLSEARFQALVKAAEVRKINSTACGTRWRRIASGRDAPSRGRGATRPQRDGVDEDLGARAAKHAAGRRDAARRALARMTC
jgi:hypothetical protein